MPYDPDFISGHSIPLPNLTDSIRLTAFDAGHPVHHTRFSLIFSQVRGFAIVAAHNIDGSSIIPAGTIDRVSFKLDPLIPREIQVDNDRGYAHNDWDRGHLVRRRALHWGDEDEARQADNDSFFYSNIAPQHEGLHDHPWGAIEDWLLELADEEDRRAAVFTGPVFTDSDPTIVNLPGEDPIRIPAGFWKIVAIRASETLQAAAFLTWHRDFGRTHPLPFDPVLEQVRVTTLEYLTGLDFGGLRALDPLRFAGGEIREVEGRRALRADTAVEVPAGITGPGDVRLIRTASKEQFSINRSKTKMNGSGRRLAVCVGINDYRGVSNDLSGCLNDANDWKDLLTGTFGFEVQTLLDSEATVGAVGGALAQLVDEAEEDDVLALTYSGHGTWEYDGPDEDEADNRDEALALYDGILLDDVIRGILSRLRSDARLTIVSDSCHSGGVTRAQLRRDFDRARGGGPEVLKVPRFLPPENDMKALRAVLLPVRGRAFYPETSMNHVLLTGCNALEYSFDAFIGGRYNGAMTYFTTQLIAADPEQSYAQLHKKLRTFLPSTSYNQSPQIEGPDALKNRPLFT